MLRACFLYDGSGTRNNTRNILFDTFLLHRIVTFKIECAEMVIIDHVECTYEFGVNISNYNNWVQFLLLLKFSLHMDFIARVSDSSYQLA